MNARTTTSALALAPNPRMVDEQMRADPHSLPELRRVIPGECFVFSAARSWGTLLRIVACSAICLMLIAAVLPHGRPYDAAQLWRIPALVVLWFTYGWVLVGLFVLGHDCGHRTFSRRRWVNTLVGYCCMAPLASSLHAWILTHDHHHAYTQRRGSDVDWAAYMVTREEFASTSPPPSFVTRLGYALPFGVFLWIFWNSLRRSISIDAILAPHRRPRERVRLRISNMITALVLVCIYGGLWRTTGFWGMVAFHGIPAAIAMMTGWVIITIQHANEDTLLYEESEWTPARGQVVSTFDIRFPRVLEWLWCDINIHVPHHVAPGVPWYHLKTAGRALRQAYQSLYQEEAFGARHIACFYRTPFLKKVESKGYYVLDASTAA